MSATNNNEAVMIIYRIAEIPCSEESLAFELGATHGWRSVPSNKTPPGSSAKTVWIGEFDEVREGLGEFVVVSSSDGRHVRYPSSAVAVYYREEVGDSNTESVTLRDIAKSNPFQESHEI